MHICAKYEDSIIHKERRAFKIAFSGHYDKMAKTDTAAHGINYELKHEQLKT